MTTPAAEATTDAIRSLTIYAAMQDPAGTEEQAGAIFDEWLDRITRRAKAEALREAAAEIEVLRARQILVTQHQQGKEDGLNRAAETLRALSDRASRIEAGE